MTAENVEITGGDCTQGNLYDKKKGFKKHICRNIITSISVHYRLFWLVYIFCVSTNSTSYKGCLSLRLSFAKCHIQQ